MEYESMQNSKEISTKITAFIISFIFYFSTITCVFVQYMSEMLRSFIILYSFFSFLFILSSHLSTTHIKYCIF